ncbi:hypothetical protein H0A36_27570 [Endozoicomonas sp. SM1973]|uniref:Uncharacterized protein n=1 Tax=Spartinivicinus marinus TaxID=2994442 RepID=A0A853IL25_9GAMM|nr:hypothetical protein [Spartinivicinus marinus]MCX4025192.1 hypothetical protein [Spartinivicinus marinus]MCX4027871.1 hypothetical protein [Spartinivicinus marinus]NYZ69775.1 hypothetical protein [Spartinivicinus marinus]
MVPEKNFSGMTPKELDAELSAEIWRLKYIRQKSKVLQEIKEYKGPYFHPDTGYKLDEFSPKERKEWYQSKIEQFKYMKSMDKLSRVRMAEMDNSEHMDIYLECKKRTANQPNS